MNQNFFAGLFISFIMSPLAFAGGGSHYAWEENNSGWGDCYEFNSAGSVLNEGQPVDQNLCPAPTFQWGQNPSGWGGCYEFGGKYAINNGQPVTTNLCGKVTFAWGKGTDGYTHCYEFGGDYALNYGQPVDNALCGSH